MANILVLGANGFIGKEVFAYFADRVIASDKNPGENILQLDITNKEEVEKFFSKHKNISSCIDFSGISLPTVCEEKKEFAYKVNVQGQKNILEACSKYNVDYYYSSTVRLYDVDNGVVDEKSEVKATNYYTETKIIAEKQAKEFFDSKKINKVIIFRFSNTFGKDSNKERLSPTIISSLKRGSIELTNSKTKFDLLYVKDIPRAIELAMENAKGFEIINVASGKQFTMEEIAKIISLKLNNNSKVVVENDNVLFHPKISIEKVKTLGFVPTEFEKVLDEIINFY